MKIVSPNSTGEIKGEPSTPFQENAAAKDTAEIELEMRAQEYSAQQRKFVIALALTLPVTVLAMGHLVPAFANILNFPSRAWIECVPAARFAL